MHWFYFEQHKTSGKTNFYKDKISESLRWMNVCAYLKDTHTHIETCNYKVGKLEFPSKALQWFLEEALSAFPPLYHSTYFKVWRECLGTAIWLSDQLDEHFLELLWSHCLQQVRNRETGQASAKLHVHPMGWTVRPFQESCELHGIHKETVDTRQGGKVTLSPASDTLIPFCLGEQKEMWEFSSLQSIPCLNPCSVGINTFWWSQPVISRSRILMEVFRGSSNHVPQNQLCLRTKGLFCLNLFTHLEDTRS